MKALTALAVLAAAALAPAALGEDFVWRLPAGVSPPPVPADNPMSKAKVALGQKLFNDTILSRDRSMSCSTCHMKHRAFSENRTTHPGVDGAAGKRNAPPLANVGYFPLLTWANPGATTLEVQGLDPVFGEHPVEMGMAGMEGEVLQRLSADACYRRLFAEAFPGEGDPVSLTSTFKALGAFQRTLVSLDSDWDRAQRGEKEAMSDQARRGEALFEAKGCRTCHSGQDFTDFQHHDIGLPPSASDEGLIEKTGRPEDANRFRTPTLRNISATGPFMHDGSIDSITAAILMHAKGSGGGPAAPVSDEEAAELSLFLETLTDRAFIGVADMERVTDRCLLPSGAG